MRIGGPAQSGRYVLIQAVGSAVIFGLLTYAFQGQHPISAVIEAVGFGVLMGLWEYFRLRRERQKRSRADRDVT